MVCTLLIASYHIQAQTAKQSRPHLFKNVSQKIIAPVSELDKAFHTPEGSNLEIKMNNFLFRGVVTSSIKRYDNLYSVIIKSPSLNNAVFALSKRINDDKSVTYVGRIINEKFADGMELVQERDGSYTMNKIQTEFLLQDF